MRNVRIQCGERTWTFAKIRARLSWRPLSLNLISRPVGVAKAFGGHLRSLSAIANRPLQAQLLAPTTAVRQPFLALERPLSSPKGAAYRPQSLM